MPAGANDALDQTRRLQIKLYLAAKRSPTRRFHALYDKVYRTDVLERAWAQVKANHGSPGVDAETIEAIEARGVVGSDRWSAYRRFPAERRAFCWAHRVSRSLRAAGDRKEVRAAVA